MGLCQYITYMHFLRVSILVSEELHYVCHSLVHLATISERHSYTESDRYEWRKVEESSRVEVWVLL
jgi:hypothetical protein